MTIESLLKSGAIIGHKDGNYGSYYPRIEEFGSEGVPFLTAKSLNNGHIDIEGAPRLSEKRASELRFGFVQPGDVLLSHNATVGRVAVVPNVSGRMLVGTSLTYFRVDNTKIAPRYLAAYFSSKGFQDQLAAVMSHSTRNQVPVTAQRSLKIVLPSMAEQVAIAEILSVFDYKIDVVRRTNETLEKIAQAIFRSWFVDFDPVRAKAEGREPQGMDAATASLFPSEFEDSELGSIPAGWRIHPIGGLAAVVGGSTPSTKKPEYWDDGEHAWATPKDLSSLTMPILLSTERKITNQGLSQISSGLLEPGTVLLSSRAPIGYLAIAEVPTAINQGFIAMKPNEGVSNLFLLFWTRASHEAIVSRANGSTFLEISKSAFRPMPVISPRPEIMASFDVTVRPLYEAVVNNEKQVRTLTELRDTLLPRLISGKLRVAEAEKLVEAVL